jgi:hypothetical protein
MNASGILDRIKTVCDKISELHSILMGADGVIIDSWKCTTLKLHALNGEGVDVDTDDPNSICCPQLSDFDVYEQ